MNESRRAKRRELGQAVEVLDLMTDQALGRIGNISATGMLLISEHDFPEEALYHIRLSLIDGSGHQRDLSIGMQHLWSDAGAVPGQVWAGFRFIDIATGDADFLRLWVEAPRA